MKVKLLLFGEAVNIPKTEIGLGVGLVSVWMDGNGFSSASNQIGALGYIFLETQEVDIGDLDDERQQIFANLHARTITFDIKPTLFIKDGGIARIAMTTSVQSGGNSVDKKIEFVAENCKGISVTTNALNITCELLQMERKFADLDSEQIVSDEQIASIVDDTPPSESEEQVASTADGAPPSESEEQVASTADGTPPSESEEARV
jgi:hypothetical protein